MKRFLSTILCLAVLVGLLSVSAQAAEPSLEVVCPESCEAGETITVDIVAKGINNCCSVSFRLSYNQDLVELADIAIADSMVSWTLVDNPDYAEGELAAAIISANAANLNGKIISVTFTAKTSAQGNAVFSLSEMDAVMPSSAAISLSGVDAATSISSMGRAVLSVTPSAGENGKLVLNVGLSNAAYYCGLSFVLSYDHTRYTVSGEGDVAKVGGFAGSMGAVNHNYGVGQVFVSAAFVDPTCLNGLVATVTLTPIEGAVGKAEEPTVIITNFLDGDYRQLDIDWTYCPAVVTGLSNNGTTVSATVNLVNFSDAEREITVFMALYSKEGRFLSVDAESRTVPAGSCGEFPVSLKADSSAECARIFFIDRRFSPVEKDIRLPVSGG